MTDMPGDIRAALIRMGFLDRDGPCEANPLTGGVASEIWKVQTRKGTVCIKQALARLKVAQRWEAPVERNSFEMAWFRTAREVVPEAVPEILGHDSQTCSFVMTWFPPQRYSVWKSHLLAGSIDLNFARQVATILVKIHNYSAGREDLQRAFATDDLFFALRPDPYFLSAAARHPDLAGALEALSGDTMATKVALVHGDISPKNILVGGLSPVILDAECAWYGDPAFDLAFCLNHLLLKCLWIPETCDRLLECFRYLAEGYLAQIGWEDRGNLESRAARLLPGLLLARVDGKSPVEYLTTDRQKELIRRVSSFFLLEPAERLGQITEAWAKAVREYEDQLERMSNRKERESSNG